MIIKDFYKFSKADLKKNCIWLDFEFADLFFNEISDGIDTSKDAVVEISSKLLKGNLEKIQEANSFYCSCEVKLNNGLNLEGLVYVRSEDFEVYFLYVFLKNDEKVSLPIFSEKSYEEEVGIIKKSLSLVIEQIYPVKVIVSILNLPKIEKVYNCPKW